MKIDLDKYYTDDAVAAYQVKKTFEVLGEDWERIIEPAAGAGAYLAHLPPTTLAYDIAPEAPNIIQQDYLTVELPFIERSLVIGNPPFGRGNNLSKQFIAASLRHSAYISFIQPISQLDNCRSKDTELIYSEDLGEMLYSGRKVHCCLNIYHLCKGKKNENYDLEGITYRRLNATTTPPAVYNADWDYRIRDWGVIYLIEDDSRWLGEIGIKVDAAKPQLKEWLGNLLRQTDLNSIAVYTTTPMLTEWRLKRYIKEKYMEEHKL